MDFILSFFKEIFTGDDTSDVSVGLSAYKQVKTPVEKVVKKQKTVAKEVRISELMRKSSC